MWASTLRATVEMTLHRTGDLTSTTPVIIITPKAKMATINSLIAANDLFIENEVLRLNRSGLNGRFRECHLAGVSCVSKRVGDGEQWSEVMRRSALFALTLFETNRTALDGSILLYASDDVWRNNNRVSRWKGLWGACDKLSSLRAKLSQVGPEIQLGEGDAIRFAGLAEVAIEEFADCAEFLRQSRSSFLFISSSRMDLTEESARVLSTLAHETDSASGTETSVLWASLACSLCSKGDVLIRANGSHSEPDAAVDFIYDPRVTTICVE